MQVERIEAALSAAKKRKHAQRTQAAVPSRSPSLARSLSFPLYLPRGFSPSLLSLARGLFLPSPLSLWGGCRYYPAHVLNPAHVLHPAHVLQQVLTGGGFGGLNATDRIYSVQLTSLHAYMA